MKVYIETVEDENFIEIVLSNFDLDLIDDGRIIRKGLIISDHKYTLGVRGQTIEEMRESEKNYR